MASETESATTQIRVGPITPEGPSEHPLASPTVGHTVVLSPIGHATPVRSCGVSASLSPPTPEALDTNLVLRPFTLDDKTVLHSMGTNPSVYRWLKYGRFPQPYTMDAAVQWLTEVAIPSATSSELPLYLAMATPDTNECMGCIALEPKKDIEHSTVEIAYWLDEPYWGRRVISHAINMIVKLGMENYPGCQRIEAGILSSNTASGKALARNGFKMEGVMRRAYEKDGKYYDKIMYGYVRGEDEQ